MRKYIAIGSIAALVVVSACTDKTVAPTAPHSVSAQPSYSVRPGTCFNAATLATLIRTMLGAGHPALNAALGKLAAMIVAVAENKIPQAQADARDLIAFLNAQLTPTTPPAQQAQVQATINAILCFVGLPPDTYIVLPSTQTQVVVATTGNTGLSLPGGSVTVPTIFTITVNDPNGPSGLNTKLDQYPTYVTVTSSSPLAQPAVVAICLGVGVPADVFGRLRLGHQASTGFEITPPADASFLGCPTNLASTSKVPRWLKSLASLVLPKVAYAKMRMFSSGGVGGSAIDFSPFGAVDYGLFATGGVGGSAIDFQQKKPTSATSKPDATATNPGVRESLKASGVGTGTGTGTGTISKGVSGGVCVSVDATVGTALDPLCRPVLTIATAKGTVLTGVPVTWAVTLGGGTIAPDALATQACGAFGSGANTSTDATGKAGICWTLGPNGGTNTATATPNFGGDAPQGVTFIDPATGNTLSNLTYTATGLKITPSPTATGASVTYDGLPHPGSGTCSNSLTPVLTYSTSDGSVPVDNGSYTLTVTCGAGSTVYNTATATATIAIGVFTPVVTVTCPPSVVFNNADQTSVCTAAATGAGSVNLGAVPVTYGPTTPHNVGPYTATGTFTAANNYASASGSGSFSITAALTTTAVTCTLTTVVYTGAAQTPCFVAVTGPGLSLTPTPIYSANTDVGTVTASYTYPVTGNYLGSSDSKQFSITQATSLATVVCPSTPTVFTGAALTPCTASVTGAGSLNLPLTASYSSNTNVGTATATASYAGDLDHAPSNLASATFQIALASSSTTVSCPATLAYTGAVQNPCTAAVSGVGLGTVVPVLYSPSPVLDAGPYTATATFPGDANHSGSGGAGGFSIAKLAATATAGSGTMLLNATVPTLPCVMGGLLAPTVTCTTKVPTTLVAGVNVTMPVVSPSSPVDYSVTTYNGQLIVHYVQSGCFASPISTTLPSTTSSSNPSKGTSVTVKCRLLDATSKPVVTATGNLAVQDMGTNGSTAGATVFSGTNVFTVHNDGDLSDDDGVYTYLLSTSPAGFISGHFYLVTATWNDGSKTNGYLYVR